MILFWPTTYGWVGGQFGGSEGCWGAQRETWDNGEGEGGFGILVGRREAFALREWDREAVGSGLGSGVENKLYCFNLFVFLVLLCQRACKLASVGGRMRVGCLSESGCDLVGRLWW